MRRGVLDERLSVAYVNVDAASRCGCRRRRRDGCTRSGERREASREQSSWDVANLVPVCNRRAFFSCSSCCLSSLTSSSSSSSTSSSSASFSFSSSLHLIHLFLLASFHLSNAPALSSPQTSLPLLASPHVLDHPDPPPPPQQQQQQHGASKQVSPHKRHLTRKATKPTTSPPHHPTTSSHRNSKASKHMDMDMDKDMKPTNIKRHKPEHNVMPPRTPQERARLRPQYVRPRRVEVAPRRGGGAGRLAVHPSCTVCRKGRARIRTEGCLAFAFALGFAWGFALDHAVGIAFAFGFARAFAFAFVSAIVSPALHVHDVLLLRANVWTPRVCFSDHIAV
ncbi:hypothetical protein MRB53_037906 [Persea americana]|nr:hypothetical protein MRB53_037906 [Persea americana]